MDWIRKSRKGESFNRMYIRLNLAPVGLHPALIAITPDNHLIVIPCQDSDNVILLDTKTLKPLRSIYLGSGSSPWMAQITPNGKYALVSLSRYAENGSPN